MLFVATSVGQAPEAHASWARYYVTTTGDTPRDAFIADLNGDGFPDVVAAEQSAGAVVWYRSDGDDPPTFERFTFGSIESPQAVSAADLDGDGDVDIISGSTNDNTIAWHENNGDSPLPQFDTHGITGAAVEPSSLYAVDLDADGDVDIVASSRSDDRVAWYENDGASSPSFTEHNLSLRVPGEFGFAHFPVSVFAADVNGDGHLDVLSASVFDDTIAWYESNGASPPGFTPREISTDADGARSVWAADLDGDGDVDVLSASNFDNTVAWYENDGTTPPAFTKRVIVEHVPQTSHNVESVVAFDFDQDGDVDVVSADVSKTWAEWHKNVGGSPPTFISSPMVPAAGQINTVHLGDVNGDGHLDIVTTATFGPTIAWYKYVPPCAGDIDGDGSTSLADFTILAANFGATGLPFGSGESRGLGDLDDDGDVTLSDFTILAADFGCDW